MGSRVDDKDEINILMTGFNAFRVEYPVNPSWEIARRLPEYLPRPCPERGHSDAISIPEVRIITPTESLRTSYEVVRGSVPSFWDGPFRDRKIDLALHIGMAGTEPVYFVERTAHRTGYKFKDVDGEFLKDEAEGRLGEDWIWYDLPEVLQSSLDVPDVLHRWKQHSPTDMDLRLSDNAGRYLCEFTLYSSMAHLHKQQRPRNVAFLHVPADASDKTVKQGVEAALSLIRSMVESEVSRGTLGRKHG